MNKGVKVCIWEACRH